MCCDFDVESVDDQGEVDQNADADDAEEDEEESREHPADDEETEEEENGKGADDHPGQQQQREAIAGAEDQESRTQRIDAEENGQNDGHYRPASCRRQI